MKPTIERIDAAIAAADEYIALGIQDEITDTALFALRLTKKMMGEPTSRMVDSGNYCEFPIVSDIFKAMRDKALNEVEDEN